MIRDEQIARLMGAGALALLVGALGFQYFAHLAPCEMCHWQRWPHIAAAVTGLLIVSFWKKDRRGLAIFTIVMVALSGLIGAYQTGMQMGILPGPSGCTVAHAYVLGSGAPPPEISCNAVTWSLFGLSLAAYNALISLSIAGAGLFLLRRSHAA
ncbi:MAG TPA: disulfide bond formation protein B [Rhizomicrobium sp.]|jgi:disulfide bond formation protein DsbB|nr:disulfide bond formation protein B [Rhizomicrobium sp.]